MREIEFRFWDTTTKKMIDWSTACRADYNKDKSFLYYLLVSSGSNFFIPMLYTNLKDKNGKKIFEGDICLCDLGTNDYLDARRFVVKFKDGAFKLTDDWVDMDSISEYWEVIGNAYENPELLEKK